MIVFLVNDDSDSEIYLHEVINLIAGNVVRHVRSHVHVRMLAHQAMSGRIGYMCCKSHLLCDLHVLFTSGFNFLHV